MMDKKVSPTQNILGFCNTCFRVRWLARVDEKHGEFSSEHASGTMPKGMCRSCAREEEEDGDQSP